MRIISKHIDITAHDPLLTDISPLSDFLFLDIETTGLGAEQASVYLIGCIYHQADGWNLIQWMDTTGSQEKEILSSFLLFASSYKILVHYNGDRFDLPFLRKRIEYQCGGDLVKIFKKFTVDPDPALMQKLLTHNEADVTGLLSLLPLLIFRDLEEPQFRVRKAQANYYTDYDGSRKEEMFLFFRLPRALPAPVYASADHCYVKIEGDSGTLKIPLYTEVMKYFYANYKDYYFLPAEDMAVHKYLASYVDKTRRVQARPETCYTRKAGSFLPQWDLFRTPFFKRAYADSELFFEFTDECKRSRDFLSEYAAYVFTHIKNS